MSTPTRIIAQALLAGVVAAALIVGARGLSASAQDDPPSPEPTAAEAAPAPAPPPDPCTLLTESEAESVLGAPATLLPDTTQCTYLADDLTGRSVSVAVTPPLPQDGGALESAMQQMAQALGGQSRPVAAGDEAFVVTSAFVSQATVRSGPHTAVVVLTAASGSHDEVTATLTSLAATAASRL